MERLLKNVFCDGGSDDDPAALIAPMAHMDSFVPLPRRGRRMRLL
jgi:hypothetical protein